jgi:hypothetical protein
VIKGRTGSRPPRRSPEAAPAPSRHIGVTARPIAEGLPRTPDAAGTALAPPLILGGRAQATSAAYPAMRFSDHRNPSPPAGGGGRCSGLGPLPVALCRRTATVELPVTPPGRRARRASLDDGCRFGDMSAFRIVERCATCISVRRRRSAPADEALGLMVSSADVASSRRSALPGSLRHRDPLALAPGAA